jgi:seryl-tRNA synthetase
MNVVHIELPAALSGELSAEIAKQAVFASRAVRALRWDTERRTARVEIEPNEEASEVEEKVRRLVSSMTERHRPLPRKVLTSNARRDRGPVIADVERELAERGFLRELGPGQIALSGPALAFARAFDARIAKLAAERFEAREESYPALIPTTVLQRCGYLSSFPHALSIVAHLVEDLDGIESFRTANAGKAALTIPDPSALALSSVCLSPAVCYHLYPTLEGRRLDQRLMAVTAAARCYRYESRNMRGLERLWDFEMREVILCGAEIDVAAARAGLMDMAFGEAVELDLDCTIESANDPFFSGAHPQKAYWQSRSDLKFELQLALPPGDAGPRSVAGASFNLHESFFGRTFGFTTEDGQPGFTGCAGWGLARWVLAAFSQHGLEPSRWPAAWRSHVFG